MTNVLDLIFKEHSGKLKGTSPRKNRLDTGLHGSEELLHYLMSQFFYDVHGWTNFVDALLDPLSIIMRTVFVEAEIVSLSAGTWLAADSFDVEVVTGTSELLLWQPLR